METSANISGEFIAFILFIFFIRNLVDLIRFIRPQNRLINPHIAWLLLLFFLKIILAIPFRYGMVSYDYYFILVYSQYAVVVFMFLFQIYLVNKIADSVVAEYNSRSVYFKSKPTFIAGIFMCVCYILVALVGFLQNLYLSALAGVLFVISFIIYWVQTHRTKKAIFNFPIMLEEEEEGSIFRGL